MRAGEFRDISGQRFGRLTPVARVPPESKGKKWRWLCICDCGGENTVTTDCLTSGSIKSCGCLRIEAGRKTGLLDLGKGNFKHGHDRHEHVSAEYRAYTNAKTRCEREEGKDYDNYGGRGIKFLFESFEQFYAELGPK